jgi:hypothetical protein
MKLGVQDSKSTIQEYIHNVRKPGLPRQTWATFLRNHAKEICCCDFLQTYDLFFRTLFAFVIIELDSRRLVHYGVTRNSTDAWVAQQLHEAIPFAQGPPYLIRDNDRKYGRSFARVASGTRIAVLRTPYGAPKANARYERFLGSVRRECLDYFLILSERHLHRVMKQYQVYFNHARPHQGIRQSRAYHVSRSYEMVRCSVQRSSLAPYWAGCIIATTGKRTRDHHIPAQPDGWDYSARTAAARLPRPIQPQASSSFVHLPVRHRGPGQGSVPQVSPRQVGALQPGAA